MLGDIKTFISKHGKEVGCYTVLTAVCYMHLVFSQNVGIDTEGMITNEPGVLESWFWIGRYGLIASKRLLGLSPYNPYFAGIIFLAAFLLLGVLIAFMCWTASDGNENYPYGMFLILFGTCPAWMAQFYFSLQRTEVVLGLLYVLISVSAFCGMVFHNKKKVFFIPLWLLFGIWGFGTYQSCVAFYIGLAVIYFLLDFAENYEKMQCKEAVRKIFWLICGFLSVYFGYMLLTKILCGEGEYLKNQISWGAMPLRDNFRHIGMHVFNVCICQGASYFSAYPLACLCMAITFVFFCKNGKVRKSLKLIFFVALAGLFATPFLLTIFMGIEPAKRTQLVLQLVSAFGCMFAYGFWKREGKSFCVWMQKALIVASAAILCLSASKLMRFQYVDDVRYQEDVRVVTHIWEDIHQIEGVEGLPLMFIGRYTPRLNDKALQDDMYGQALVGWDTTQEYPAGTTGRVIGLMKALGMEATGTQENSAEAVAAAKGMESYPNKGYISVQDGIVIVKLSDPD